jgi:hypothetical protein
MNAARKAGVKLHPHQLRKFFNTTMKLAGVNDTLVEYWMGHKLPEAKAAYLVPPIEKQAEVYMRAYPQLSFQAVEATKLKEEATLEALRRFAEAFGIDPMRIKIEREKELGRELNASEEIELIQNELKKLREGKQGPKRIVSEEELEGYLAEGWQFVSVLPSQRILIRRS